MKQNKSRHLWPFRLALLTGVVVGVLSIISGVKPLWLTFRIAVAFTIIYSLTQGSIYLFEQTAHKSQPEMSHRGVLLDIAVGKEPEAGFLKEEAEEGFFKEPENINTNIPGQIKPDLFQGMPDEEKQAEIVRRMGWGDNN